MEGYLTSRLKGLGISVWSSQEADPNTALVEIRVSSFSKPLLNYCLDVVMRDTGAEPVELTTTMKDGGYHALYRVQPGSRLVEALRPQSTHTASR